MKVMIIGHALCPDMGSEPGFTWNSAWWLSRRHQVTVLSYPLYRQRVEAALSDRRTPAFTVRWVTLPKWRDPLRPQRSHTRFFKLHYILWQWEAARIAQELCQTEGFDVVHHISLGTLHAPPALHGLPVPVIWGPIGGGQTLPLAFRKYMGAEIGRELFRHATVRLLPLHPALRRMARAAAVTLCINRETRRIVERAGARRVESFLDGGVKPEAVARSSPARSAHNELRLLWAGRCEPRKALPLGLEALARVRAPVHLTVAGEGPLLESWKNYAHELQLSDRVEFLGQVPWQTMSDLFDNSDVFLFTSLRDTFGSVVLEAMAHGLPILTLNHQGVGDFVPDEAGIKVSVHSPPRTIAELAHAIEALADSPDRRQRMGAAALEKAREETWDRRTERFERLYRQVCEMPLGAGLITTPAGVSRR